MNKAGSGVEFDNATTSRQTSPEIESVVRARVEHLRARLLDSSRRNPLIQVPFRKNSSSLIRFVDELPDVLAERLSSQISMRLAALPPIDEPLPDESTDAFLDALEIARTSDVAYLAASAELDPTDPDYAQKEIELERELKDRVREELGLPKRQTEENPSLAEHARAHDISPSYILPLASDAHEDGRHDDSDIQTLLLPDRLERVSRSLHDRGHAFERETGVNVLHAAFGILEWSEPGSSRSPALSPLLLLEIRMERKKAPGGAEYHICGENELSLNTTLAQTLSAQFGLELPPFEGGSVEDYFQQVSDLAPKGWHWALRREALAGVFPSSRIAMYRDLEPENGPVVESPLVQSMLSSVGGGGASYAEDYDTDDPEIERCVPRLIMDADASQFSSLVDVANGSNVAIEGPPGSGKSQTIVNLIASAMADGKRVLFVAEKLTALDVVRNRLDAAGLGEFILPLQAGRGSRDAVFQSLEDRIGMERPRSGSAAAHKARHEALCRRREEMQLHLDTLGTKMGQTGLTVHEALGQAIATARHLDGLPRDIRRIRLTAPEQIDPETRESILADAKMVFDRLGGAGHIAPFWRRARQAPLRVDEAEDLATDLLTLARGIEAFRRFAAKEVACAFLPDEPIDADPGATIEALKVLGENETIDPEIARGLLDDAFRQAAEEACEARDDEQQASQDLANLLRDPEAEDVDELLAAAREFAEADEGEIAPKAIHEEVRELEESCEGMAHKHALAAGLPARWAEQACQAGATLADLRLDAEMLLRTPEAILARRQPDDARTTPALAREAATTQRKLASDLAALQKDLPTAGSHQTREISAAANAIEEAGMFRFFSQTYKSAWNFFRDDLGGNPKSDRGIAAARLRDYAAWAERRDSFAGEVRFTTALGTLFSGLDSDATQLEALASFHETVARISQGDERLRYALEAAPLDPVRDFASEPDMPSSLIQELAKQIEESRADLSEAREDLEEARRICARFHDAPCLDLELIDRAIDARRRIQASRRAFEASPARMLLEAQPDTEVLRAAIAVAGAIKTLPDAEVALEALGSGRIAEIIESAQRLFDKQGSLQEEAASIAGELDLPDPQERGPLRLLADREAEIEAAVAAPQGLAVSPRSRRASWALSRTGFSPARVPRTSATSSRSPTPSSPAASQITSKPGTAPFSMPGTGPISTGCAPRSPPSTPISRGSRATPSGRICSSAARRPQAMARARWAPTPR
ncbi:DUF4011 domain-containing protein [Roseivivax sp. CAU 1761]